MEFSSIKNHLAVIHEFVMKMEKESSTSSKGSSGSKKDSSDVKILESTPGGKPPSVSKPVEILLLSHKDLADSFVSQLK
jgi:hypothetical protein